MRGGKHGFIGIGFNQSFGSWNVSQQVLTYNIKLGILIYLKLHLTSISNFYNFYKLDYIFILNIKTLFYP